ncbi:MAG: Fe-S cluster assembly protein SufB [Anaeroplasmataceae bacterium]|nr:Fe-S cluster assembly protein SufB [Anaeroplasmataceae bacterium]
MSNTKIDEIIGDYKYGFKTDAKAVLTSGKGLSKKVVEFISKAKNEPEWMREFRLKSYDAFLNLNNPNWGPDLTGIDFNDYTYYIKSTEKTEKSWDDVPDKIKDTFEKLGIPEAEAKYLAGSSTQFESEVVYHNNLKELDELGVIFCDTDTALRCYSDLMKQFFGKLVPYTDNKYAALNSAVWSGGSFIYVPKGVKLKKPVQSYFRINSERMGQFERTLIIVDDDADIHYVEGCTAPQYSKDSLHAAVVEIFVGKRAHCRYSTVQNWSNNIVNLVTKRAIVDDEGHMEWIDGNVGAGLNMKYPACVLKGRNSKGTTVSIAFAAENQIQDTGAKMIHLGENSSSTIISKSICRGGGKVNYRGTASCGAKALGARSHIECDTLILDEKSTSDTIPTNVGKNSDMFIEHEATVSKVNEEQLFYLMSRGLTEAEATEMIVMGFIEPFSKELPMEYAVELNRLIKLEMTDSIG